MGSAEELSAATTAVNAFAIDEVFGIIDSSASGRIDADNLLPILNRAGLNLTRKSVQDMMIASFGTATLTPVTFKRILEQSTVISTDQDKEAADLLWALQQISIPGTELVKIKTIQQYLQAFGLELPKGQFDRIFAGLHIESNGTLEYRELIDHFLSNRTYLRK